VERFRRAVLRSGSKDASPRGRDQAPDYTPEEHETWRLLFSPASAPSGARLRRIPGRPRAHAFPRSGFRLCAPRRRSRRDDHWRVARVPGLLHEEDFSRTSRRVFPSTDFIRPRRGWTTHRRPISLRCLRAHADDHEPRVCHFYQRLGMAALAARGTIGAGSSGSTGSPWSSD
jgi:phenylalanine-4-hydroxylase